MNEAMHEAKHEKEGADDAGMLADEGNPRRKAKEEEGNERRNDKVPLAHWVVCVRKSILEEKIPVVGRGFGRLAPAAEEPLEGFLLRVLAKHTYLHAPRRRDDHLVLVVDVLRVEVIEAHVPHDAVHEARGERGRLRAVDDALKVGREPYRDVRRGRARFHLEFGVIVVAVLQRRVSK